MRDSSTEKNGTWVYQVNEFISLINHLKGKGNLPAIVFVFSKKNITFLSEFAAAGLDLTTAQERKQIAAFFHQCISRLKPHDREILQIQSLKDILVRGVGVHHGDLLPVCKEIVELLLHKNLVKLLFATESFAMGVNMPAKSVVFYAIRKFDNSGFRELSNGEYTQMCGRAGRRGLDAEGFSYIFVPDQESYPEAQTLKVMLDSAGETLVSKFKLNYQIIVNAFSGDIDFNVSLSD